MSTSRSSTEFNAEQHHLTTTYAALDAELAAAAQHLRSELGESDTTDLVHREAAVEFWRRRREQLRAAETGLCFGRLDLTTDAPRHIGRLGLHSDDTDEPLLIDWRAPAARPFYRATGARPGEVVRRRHFRTRGRALLDFHDDLLRTTDPEEHTTGADSALLTALDAPRGRRMRDIVATIQAEQDEIIRHDHQGVLVIEGGPGTGKTAVALHRVAFLLYEQRERLSRRGVLIVGPNPGFLDHISSVLPSLGETDIVFATPGALYPGVHATVADTPARARIKGSVSMVDVLIRAVADRQELPSEPLAIALDDVTVHVDAAVAAEARRRARTAGRQHNPARRVFREQLGWLLVDQGVRRIGEGWLEGDEPAELVDDLRADVRGELRAHPDFHASVDVLWPELTPERLLEDLLGSPERLRAAGGDDSLLVLHRSDGAAWTGSDVALLDEAAELLGEDTLDAERAAARRQREERDFAVELLAGIEDYDDPDGESLRSRDVVDADALADRHVEGDHRVLAERAVADRSWVYGHLVVDEAQELSPMTWRVLMRRCPSRSATVVGDRAQRRADEGAHDWSSVLRPHVDDRWVFRALRTNYRTPVEIMRLAAQVLPTMSPAPQPPDSVRRGQRPWRHHVPPDQLATAVAEAALGAAAEDGDRSVAVLGVPHQLRAVDVPSDVVALSPAQAKGLEFDVVIVVEPAEILAQEAGGAADLYVAMTRATQRLGVVHAAPLPDCLRDPVAWGERGEPNR